VAQRDKAMTVAKLRGARERKKRLTGKCAGGKSISELRPDVVALARELRRRRPKPTCVIVTELAARDHLAGSGKPSSRRPWRGCCAPDRERRARSRRRDLHR
jgi:hypothetical protein